MIDHILHNVHHVRADVVEWYRTISDIVHTLQPKAYNKFNIMLSSVKYTFVGEYSIITINFERKLDELLIW